jgi:hypothetical protein
MKTNWRDWLKTVGVFTFMGPPIGWISMSTAATIAGAFTGLTKGSDLMYFFPGLIFGSLWSYIMAEFQRSQAECLLEYLNTV